jgi:metal-responsive CopG/Arc/MetJ family transcriptional regulator
MAKTKTVKTQVVFPETLLRRLDQIVEKKRRSDFVIEAVEERLKALSLRDSLHGVVGLWKDRRDLKTEADAMGFLKELRTSDRPREKRLKKAWGDG